MINIAVYYYIFNVKTNVYLFTTYRLCHRTNIILKPVAHPSPYVKTERNLKIPNKYIDS